MLLFIATVSKNSLMVYRTVAIRGSELRKLCTSKSGVETLEHVEHGGKTDLSSINRW
jgi:hypothetical protein